MACCRCSRSGVCSNCVCKRSGRTCTDCLPGESNRCVNRDHTSPNGVGSHCLSSAIDNSPQTTVSTDIASSVGVSTIRQPIVTTQHETTHATTMGFSWGKLTGEEFCRKIGESYEVIVHWRRNLFLIPSGSSGKVFVAEVAKLFQCYAENDAIQPIALKTCMVMQALLLQKPRRQSKTKEHTIALKRRLALWNNGEITLLLEEGQSIQSRLTSLPKVDHDDKVSRRFTKLMSMGKIREALKCIDSDISGSILNLHDNVAIHNQIPETVLDRLKNLHPPAQPSSPDTLMHDHITNSLPSSDYIFEAIDAALIKKVACQTQGSAGPSGLDAYAWKRTCTAFGNASNNLCQALAEVAKKLCTTSVDSQGLSALVACRLIPLDKCPGVRPIGIGETARRIIAKAIMRVARADITHAVGSIQVCAGQEGGCEAAIHAVNNLFSQDDTEAVLLADASNAFNSLNRSTALHNMNFICPTLAKVLNNTYQAPICLFVQGGEEIKSCEGTTQGDPLAMAMYALAIRPLIKDLHDLCPEASQIWFADDTTAASKCIALRKRWDLLCNLGPKYGYFPNVSKSYLIVKESFASEASRVFHDTNVIITTRGARHLGAALGSTEFIHDFVKLKVSKWCEEVKKNR